MIRAGARAPPPPPLPTTPLIPKPPHSRGAEGYRERLVHRVRQAGNLREKVVQLASQKEKQQQQQQQADDIIRLTLAHRFGKQRQHLEDHPEQGQDITVQVFDLKTGGDASTGKNAIGCSTPDKGGRRNKREQTGPMESNVDASLSVGRGSGQHLSLNMQPQTSPSECTPFPRSAAQRLRSSHPHPPASVPALGSPQPSPKHHGVHTSGIPSQPTPTQAYHVPPQKEEHHQRHEAAKPLTSTATPPASRIRPTAARTTARSMKTPSRFVMNSRASNVQETSTPASSPRSQESHRQLPSPENITAGHTDYEEPRKRTTPPPIGHLSSPSHHPSRSQESQKPPISRNITGQPDPEENSKQTDASDEHLASSSDPASRPGRSVNYRRAARVVRAQHAPVPPATDHAKRQGTKEHAAHRPKTVRFLSDDTTRRHCSSGSSGGSPRQPASRGVEEAVGEVKGNAVPPSPHHLHTQLSPRRADHKNPSHFASSLEMFKRRLKMNHCRIVTDKTTEEEEDYIIRLGGAVPISKTSWQQISGFKLRPHEPQPPSPLQPQHQHPETNHLRNHPTDENPQKTNASRNTASALQEENLDYGFGDVNVGGELPPYHRAHGEGEEGAKRKEEEEAEEGGRGMEDGGKDYTTTASCRLPESSENWTYVPLGDAARVPLPQVKTYVVENNLTSLLQARAQTHLHLALTQHNVHLHDIFLQRRTEREKMMQKRAELERRAGFVPGGEAGGGGKRGGEEKGGGEGHRRGCLANPDAESRMRRWLVDTEHYQRDQQPLVNFKIAIPAA